jgi:hypothetical protein
MSWYPTKRIVLSGLVESFPSFFVFVVLLLIVKIQTICLFVLLILVSEAKRKRQQSEFCSPLIP